MKSRVFDMILSAGLVFTAGCASHRAPMDSLEVPVAIQAEAPRVPFSGVVIRVNDEFRYVVMQCTILPSIGEEAKVVRDGKIVGRIQVSGPTHSPFTVADILEGTVKTGDEARQ